MAMAVFFGLFWLVFVCVFGVIIFTIVRSLTQWNKNNHAPRLRVAATVVAKRTDLHRHHHAGEHHHHSVHQTYYVTFEVESGDRMELSVEGNQYGLLVEGDRGSLTFQGTRFLQFEREF